MKMTLNLPPGGTRSLERITRNHFNLTVLSKYHLQNLIGAVSNVISE
jgi:hypothetical protein